MDYEQIIITLKGISCMLTALDEVNIAKIDWSNWGVHLLNKELMECIHALEENFQQ